MLEGVYLVIYTPNTYADRFRPRRLSLLYDVALILGGAWLVAISAQIAVRLPFSPVPVTGQTFAVLLVGALLGSRRGGLSMLTYLGQGLAGLPVFANGGSGPAYVSGPTGGYLIGFVAAAFVVGWLAEHHWDRHALTTALAMLLGNLVIYFCGVMWLSSFVGIENAWSAGLVPFIAGDVVKIGLAAALLPSGWRFVNRGM